MRGRPERKWRLTGAFLATAVRATIADTSNLPARFAEDDE
jgi:hypothetical protein